MRFTAILTVTRRNINSLSPKRMLLQVRGDNRLYRQHLWLHESMLGKYLDTTNHKKRAIIEFTAEPNEYMSADGMKQGLTKIKDIKVIKYFKVK